MLGEKCRRERRGRLLRKASSREPRQGRLQPCRNIVANCDCLLLLANVVTSKFTGMKSLLAMAGIFMSLVFTVRMGVAGQQPRPAPGQVYGRPGPAPVQHEFPDKAIVAIVFSSGSPGHEGYESRVEVRSKSGKLLVQRGYVSADGQHGYKVQKAAWTPDSNFFVYSMETSGGHQPWHSPVNYYSRAQNRFRSLDDALHDAVANPQFSISASDRVAVELWFSKAMRTVSLSALVPRE
jgi:hypothetical protein